MRLLNQTVKATMKKLQLNHSLYVQTLNLIKKINLLDLINNNN